jgi:hypothetical protein
VLNGWIENHRHHGQLVFLDLRDRYGVTQIVVDQEVPGTAPGTFDLVRRLGGEDVLSVSGRVRPRAAVRGARQGRGERGAAHAVPLPRPAPPALAGGADQTRALRHRDPQLPAAEPVHRHRDADPDQEHAGGGARLPGAEPRAPGQVLRAAAEPADLQAAVHGRGARPLLPDRALLPRRGPARRPPARVHADRHRDVVRRGARRARHGRGHGRAGHARRVRHRAAAAVPALRLLRGDGQVRLRQARPALRHDARRLHGVGAEERLQGLRRRRRRRRHRQGHLRRGRGGEVLAQGHRRADGIRHRARRQGPRVGEGHRRRGRGLDREVLR